MGDYSALNLGDKRPKISTERLVKHNIESDSDYFLFTELFAAYLNKRKLVNVSLIDIVILLLYYECSMKGKFSVKTGQISIISSFPYRSIERYTERLKRAGFMYGGKSGISLTDAGILFVRGLKTQLRQRKMKVKRLIAKMHE